VLSDLVTAIHAAPARLGRVKLVAIDGPSGSGKSILARRLHAELGSAAALVSTDDFATWDDPVSWWPRLRDGVLTPLAADRPGRYRRVDWSSGAPRPGEMVTVRVPEILILEGVSAGRRSVRDALSLLIWCEEPDPVTRLERAVTRDGEANRAALYNWQLFEIGWFAVDDPRTASAIRQTAE
jgi:hypothetical protein